MYCQTSERRRAARGIVLRCAVLRCALLCCAVRFRRRLRSAEEERTLEEERGEEREEKRWGEAVAATQCA